MATTRRRKTKSRSSKLTAEAAKLKKQFTSLVWAALILLVLYFVGRYVATDVYNDTKAKWDSDRIEELEDVKFPDDVDNMKIVYTGFTVYFNSEHHIPNCVIYELTGEETDGEYPRYKNFLIDEQVPGCANPWDYTHSGYTRGHMAPAGDMKWDREAMKESFYMTNMCPQKASLNSGGWGKLEDKVRRWACRDSAIIVASGPILTPQMTTIGENRVAVPERFYKVVLAPYATPMRAIAFVYPNDSSSGAISNYAVTVDEVERLTGIDFFSALDDDDEHEIESTFNLLQWELQE